MADLLSLLFLRKYTNTAQEKLSVNVMTYRNPFISNELFLLSLPFLIISFLLF